MPTTFSERSPSTLTRLACFVPAICAFVGAAYVEHRATILLLLTADVLTVAATCRALGLARDARFGELALRRGFSYFLLLGGYTALIAVLIGYPLSELSREGSFGAALAVSSAGVIALIGVWRWWPAFGMVMLWKRAYPRDIGPHRGTALGRSIAGAWELTDANDLFFSHGLLAAFCLAALAQGALSIAGIEGAVPAALRIPAIAIYGALLAPLASTLVLLRSANALVHDRRRVRNEHRRHAPDEASAEAVEPAPAVPTGLTGAELDSMLLRCIRAGQAELALAALEHGANPNAVPEPDERDQRSALMLATVNPDMRLLRGLIERRADVNAMHAGITPLLAATRDSYEGRPEAVMMLLTNGADPRCTDVDGNTPLHHAALAARPIVAALLCDAEAPLNAVNRDGLTPLGVACVAANWELARYLLERGAKLEVEHAQPAILAAASVADDDPQGVKLLLKRRARVDAPAALSRTALMTAALHGRAAIAKALLEGGAAIDRADALGTTALMEAARSGAHGVLDVFKEHRPAVDAADNHGRTALIIASQSKQACEQTVRRLLDLGASPDVRTPDGKRAADYAAAAGRWNVVALLDPTYPLPASVASVDTAPPRADSPAHLLDALRFGHWNVVENFADRVHSFAPAELAGIFAELATSRDAGGRRWLLNRGLRPDACLSDGRSLLGDAFERLPGSAGAVADLLDAGAPAGGSDGIPRLCAAMRSERADAARLESLALMMIERGAELFAGDADGRTPLAHALAAGSMTLVRELLARGVDPNARDRRGRTPLFDALALPGEAAQIAVKMLMFAGADPEAVAVNGETPLGIALSRGTPELQEWLNWRGWKPPQHRLRGTDLIAAAASGDRGAVQKLLALGLPIDAIDAQGASALLRAAGGGHAPVVECLLAHGADAALAAPTGATALSAAVSARRESVVETLLAHGVGVDQRLPGGGTPLMIAAALGYPEIVAALLARGAAVDAEDLRGMRAIHAAAQFAFQSREGERAKRTVELLLVHGAQVNATNAIGQTPLLLLLGARAEPGAVVDQRQILALLPLLLDRRADLNVQDKRGVSALHACAMHGLLLPARALLAAGADRERRDILDRTPRQIAHLLGFIDVAAELGGGAAVPGAAQTLKQPARGFDPA